MGRQEICAKKLNAKFFVRVLPSLDFAAEDIKIDANAKVMYVRCLQKRRTDDGVKRDMFWSFAADGIFWNASQESVYATVCGDLVKNLVEGVSGLVLAYGESGSGKTYTVSGLRHRYENRGLVLRLLSGLCSERKASQDFKKISIEMSYVEFIGSAMKDLLANKSTDKFKENKTVEVVEEVDAWRLIFEAEVRRSANENAPYQGSHRGHSVLTFYVKTVSLMESEPVCMCCKVHIVDMAGIDTLGDPNWRTPSDLGYANLSKTLMEQLILCINGKTWNMPQRVCPFKTSKMLHFLHDTLQPHCVIRFVGHVLGERDKLPMTLSILRFGEKVKGFKAARLERGTTEKHPSVAVKALETEMRRLRAELYLNEMLNDSPNYSNMSQDRVNQIRDAAQHFLLGDLDNLTLLSVGQAEIMLNVMRELYEKVTREKEQAVKEALGEAHSQPSSLRSLPFPTSSSSLFKVSKKRSGRQEPVTAPYRSYETNATGMQKHSATAVQVGHLDKKGISVGQGKSTASFEGLVTKAFKRVRSRRSDSVLRPEPKSSSTKDRGVPCSKDNIPEDSSASLPTIMPTKEEAWQQFCADRSDLIRSYQEEISKVEENARVARRNYAVALCEMSKIKEALEKVKKDAEDWNHISNLNKYGCGREDEDSESCEVMVRNNLAKKEVELSNAVECCHTAYVDLRNNIEDALEAKLALDNEFRVYCHSVYDIEMAVVDRKSTGEQELKISAESTDAVEDVNQMRMEMYAQFQTKMMNHRHKNVKPKWVSRF